MPDIILLHALSDSLVAVLYDGDKALWTERTLRKTTQCANCGAKLTLGQKAWGPIGNQSYRYARLCQLCIRQ